MRTGWSFTQKYIQDDLIDIEDSSIGMMDTAFLLFLGIGLYFAGNISNAIKYHPLLLFYHFIYVGICFYKKVKGLVQSLFFYTEWCSLQYL